MIWLSVFIVLFGVYLLWLDWRVAKTYQALKFMCLYQEQQEASVVGCSTMTDVAEPRDWGNGNVLFPENWSHEQCAKWRQANNVPGYEWQHD